MLILLAYEYYASSVRSKPNRHVIASCGNVIKKQLGHGEVTIRRQNEPQGPHFRPQTKVAMKSTLLRMIPALVRSRSRIVRRVKMNCLLFHLLEG